MHHADWKMRARENKKKGLAKLTVFQNRSLSAKAAKQHPKEYKKAHERYASPEEY